MRIISESNQTIGRCKDLHAHAMNVSEVGRLFITCVVRRLTFPSNPPMSSTEPTEPTEAEKVVLQSVKNKLAHSLLTKATKKRKSKSVFRVTVHQTDTSFPLEIPLATRTIPLERIQRTRRPTSRMVATSHVLVVCWNAST